MSGPTLGPPAVRGLLGGSGFAAAIRAWVGLAWGCIIDAVVALVRAAHPDAFGDGGEP